MTDKYNKMTFVIARIFCFSLERYLFLRKEVKRSSYNEVQLKTISFIFRVGKIDWKKGAKQFWGVKIYLKEIIKKKLGERTSDVKGLTTSNEGVQPTSSPATSVQ